MNILIVGQVDSIFFRDYVSSAITKNDNMYIECYSVTNDLGKFSHEFNFNYRVTSYYSTFIPKIKFFRSFIKPFYIGIELLLYLLLNKNKYNVLHFKWLLPEIVLFSPIYKFFPFKIISTLWGGELESLKLFGSRKLYFLFFKKMVINSSYITVFTHEKEQQLISYNINKLKIKKFLYGSNIISNIEILVSNGNRLHSKSIFNIPDNLISICVGYSGKSLHQQLEFLNFIIRNNLTEEFSSKFFLIFPMTYGFDSNLHDSLLLVLRKFNFKFIILTQKMSDLEVAYLRHSTDIFLQISTFDGLSSSLIEGFLSGSIIICGDWLPYESFKKSGLYFHEIDGLNLSLFKLLDFLYMNFDNEYNKCKVNKNILGFNQTWNNQIGNWLNLYY
ncbi:hypothetical protein [Algoriphagus sp. CAU 1675]|uniref:hypothetical protein n=1 Tax=Algoriphagus sp. CAU 1675 TaxID=3032597 RepID=UPI0023DC49E5|nr:hypothetical protein [Algoriphagus sp. CAU 1675]MDF2158192.1 hypothetical protein [Algoriphagus sp. CAU 1675]